MRPTELLDIDIDEISVVDVPATKRKFLVIKRDDSAARLAAIEKSLERSEAILKRGGPETMYQRLMKRSAHKPYCEVVLDEMDERAEELRKSNPGLTKAQAFTRYAATKEGGELYAELKRDDAKGLTVAEVAKRDRERRPDERVTALAKRYSPSDFAAGLEEVRKRDPKAWEAWRASIARSAA